MSPEPTAPAVVNPFDDRHYASTFLKKLVRAGQLGLPYYCWHVPKYFWLRHRLGLPSFDGEVLWNPLREFRNADGLSEQPLPGHFDRALQMAGAAGIRFTIPYIRLAALSRAWWLSTQVTGDAIECGSYEGATALLMALLGHLNGVDQKVLMLDTFTSEPAHSHYDISRTDLEFLLPANQVGHIHDQAELLGIKDRIEVHAGLFSQTLPALANRQLELAFAHVDANLYSSTLAACEFVIPRMRAKGFVVFDDYNGVRDLGARLAIDQFAHLSPLKLRPLAATSAFVEISARS